MVVLYDKQSTDTILTPESLSFTQINTQDYDLSRVQTNVNLLKTQLVTILTQLKYNLFTAKSTISTSLSSPGSISSGYRLILNEGQSDKYNAYDTKNNSFVCPVNAVYTISVTVRANCSAALNAALYLRQGASNTGPASTTELIDCNTQGPLNGSIFLRNTVSLQLTQNTSLSFLVCWTEAQSANLSGSTVSIGWSP